MRNEKLLAMARMVEKTAQDIRYLSTGYDIEEVNNKPQKFAVLNFAGSLCSMASSILCELYESEDSEFNIVHANNVLREWGLEELTQ